MIEIRLSERDFDYELQALVNSFFPGKRSVVVADDENKQAATGGGEYSADGLNCPYEVCIYIYLGQDSIKITVKCLNVADDKGDSGKEYVASGESSVTGTEDWHKHPDKSAHPYRTYYKNVLKKLLFKLLKELPEYSLPSGYIRTVPEWGTMTGVRPTKIIMNEIMAGGADKDIRNNIKHTYCCSDDKIRLGMDIAKREADILRDIDCEKGYSLYVGIPFCPTTCLYCSFTSYPYERFGYLSDAYLGALKKEIRAVGGMCANKKPTSIYIGGGTPTTLTPVQLKELIECIKEEFDTSCEFTVEAGRPDSITAEKLKVLYDYGVRRISVNPQTMQQKTLDVIGRRHTVQQTVNAFKMARSIGFDNINMDLIIGLPEEGIEEFSDTLNRIEELNPDSVTIHSLVVKRASRLRSELEDGRETGASQEKKRLCMEQMLKMGHQFAEKNNYKPYYMYRQKNSAGHAGSTGQENIGYAREGSECIYNILIMEEMQTIIAVGAGASTKLYNSSLKQVSRVENVKSVSDYIDRIDEMIERKAGIW